jgi:hypothetical protein
VQERHSLGWITWKNPKEHKERKGCGKEKDMEDYAKELEL